MIEKLIDIFYPKTCPICGKVIGRNQMICRACQKDLSVIHDPRCEKCGQQLYSNEKIYCKDCSEYRHFFERGVAVFEYQGKICQSIYRFKYQNVREYASFYGIMAVKLYGTFFRKWDIQKIIPIPIHQSKKIRRGYNQSLVFAEVISKKVGIPIEKRALIRNKKTIPQKGLTRQIRYQNLKDAFCIYPEFLKGVENVLLVDDIYTTGSTVDACAKILKTAGVRNVYFLCIANGNGDE